MQALILCGGKGERLRPLTSNIPKPMIKINGKPILEYIIDHILLLFPFEKKYFDEENINSTFTGHPLLEVQEESKIDLSKIIKGNKRLFSIYPGSRLFEINVLAPILFEFIKLMNKKYNDIF